MYLEQIQSSEDLKALSFPELSVLADELRTFLVKTVAKTGGHLAANLGVVELTIALHRVFSPENDRLIWDVGHQSYTHKILTGRREAFDTLRQFGGISGFPKSEESPADAFNTGHSSTSISAATGYAVAAKLRGEDSTAVAIIGDGALNGGMAFEALNHAGTLQVPLVVVYNDNGMSISENVSAVARRLKKIRNTRRYFNLKSNVKTTLDKIPGVGAPLKKVVINLKKQVKRLIFKDVFFEDFGFCYYGPVDGHNISAMEVLLSQAKESGEPAVVHVHTKKGKGYLPAEKDPDYFHGVSRFDFETGKPIQSPASQTWSDYFGDKLCALAEKNEKILAVTASMPCGTGLKPFAQKFPNRFFDVGIAEQHAVTFSAGLAKGGFVPCFAVYSTFLQRAYDQLLHDVALQNLHVVFCIDRSGPVGADGETHQGVFDISYLSHLPNFTVFSPSNREDFDIMLEYAFSSATGPVAIRYPRGTVLELPERLQGEKPSLAPRILCGGGDVLLVAAGAVVPDALSAAHDLKECGIFASVMDIRVIKPLPIEIVRQCAKDKKIVAVLEDNVEVGGLGQQIAAELGSPVLKFAYPDTGIVHGTVPELKEKYGLSVPQIVSRIRKEMKV